MSAPKQRDDEVFENEVRRIARHLWPQAEFGGSAIIGGRERDGVFETEECIHIIEATRSRQREKARTDINKLASLAAELRKHPGQRAVQCWFITESEPTAEQRGALSREKGPVNILSFRQFQSKLIDASSYLNARDDCPFGSIRNPGTGTGNPIVGYVPLDLVDQKSDQLWEIGRLIDHVSQGGRVLLLGDYGAGKSMTMRELFQDLKKRYMRGQTARFPIYLNMRDHFGQPEATEILERHARRIGFPNPSHLVRSWRAGYGILLLDGFDEVAGLGIQGAWRKLRDSRFRAMQAIRQFVRETPTGVGLAIAGRAHFFDNEVERSTALATDAAVLTLNLNEFTDDQIREYLARSKYKGQVPPWMPSRPLLVGYLVARGLLLSSEDLTGLGPAEGWDELLNRISSREAEIEAGIDGPTVRRILERIATKARSLLSGVGPIAADDLVLAFREICGYPPDEQALVLLQRLPGLGVDPSGAEARSFIDTDLADACRAGDVVEFLSTPYEFDRQLFCENESCLGDLGVSVAALRASREGSAQGNVTAALRRAAEGERSHGLVADLVRIAAAQGYEVEPKTYVKDVLVVDWALSAPAGDLRSVTFQNCYFTRLEIDPDVDVLRLPRFVGCFVGEFEGRVSRQDLPAGVFDDACVIDSFAEATETTRAILDMDMPLGARVLLTILKKLYVQRGRGRRENALYRGLDQRSRRLVPDVLHLLAGEGLATPHKTGGVTVWLPNRTEMARIGRVLASPRMSTDSLLQQAGSLS